MGFRVKLRPKQPTFVRTYRKNHSGEPYKGRFYRVQVRLKG